MAISVPPDTPPTARSKARKFVEWSAKPLKPLFGTFRFKPSQFWFGEYVAATVGAGGGAWLAVAEPQATATAIPVAGGLVGVIIGAVIAGVALQAASFDQTFLRMLDATQLSPDKKDVVRYISPFLFTATVGISAGISLMVWAAVSPTAPGVWRAIFGGTAGLLSLEAFASLIPALSTLVQFIRLLQASARAAERLKKNPSQ